MNKIKRFVISCSALLLFSGVSLTATALALENGGVTNDVLADPPHSAVPVSEDSQTQTGSNRASDGDELADQLREQAKGKVQAARQEAKNQRSQAARQKACTARKNNLAKRMDNSDKQAMRHKQVFDNIYQKVQDFYKNKQLNVPDYGSLKAATDSAQANAQASIDALKALSTDGIDCSSSNVAESISAYQSAVKDARDSLKSYRAALVDLINSLKGASTGAGSGSSGSADNTTNTTDQ